MRILVTGNEGFIGQHVTRLLRAGGHNVCGFDRAKHPACELTMMTPDALGDFAPEAMIHLAAHADVKDNWEDADQLAAIERDNVTATLRLLEAARQCGTVTKFIFVSTGAVYANCIGTVTEDTSCIAASPYAASKLAGEAYVQAYAEKCGWGWVALRPAACVGSGYHHGHIADFVRKSRGAQSFVALDNGAVSRPALHVEDFAEVIVHAAAGSIPSGVYNVAGPTMWSWRQTALEMGITVEPGTSQNGWIGDSQGASFDTTKLLSTGITCERPIIDGVRDALKGLGWAR